MTTFRRRPANRSRFRRRRNGTIYEMQHVSFTHDTVTAPPLPAPTVSQDIFLLAHPRLEWAITGPIPVTDQGALPIAKGVVIDGLRHSLLMAYVPQFETVGTATAGGVLTIHAGLVRIPTDESMTPLSLPNAADGGFLYSNDDQATSGAANTSRQKWRIMWRQQYQLAVVDGTLTSAAGVPSAQSAFFDAGFSTGGFGGGTQEFQRVKTKVRLGMDDGLFLVVECRTPFAGGADVVVGLDYWAVMPVKPLTRGAQYR